jgi:RNA polymerase-binding protein DksA
MAERVGSVRKTPKSTVPAQSATKSQKTGVRVTDAASETPDSVRPTKAAAKKAVPSASATANDMTGAVETDAAQPLAKAPPASAAKKAAKSAGKDETGTQTTPAKAAPKRATAKKAEEPVGSPASTAGAAPSSKSTPPTKAKTSAPARATKSAARGAATEPRPEPQAATAAADPQTRARPTRSAEETERIREALAERRDELRAELEQTMSEIAEAQRERLTDSAGDDQADTGTKTFEREQEISLANSIRERVSQVERALDRLDDGQYGWCERCGNPIPVERLAAFPSATLCVTCKQLEERR